MKNQRGSPMPFQLTHLRWFASRRPRSNLVRCVPFVDHITIFCQNIVCKIFMSMWAIF